MESEGIAGEATMKVSSGWKSCVRVASSCLNGAVVSFFSGWSCCRSATFMGSFHGGRALVMTLLLRMLVTASESQWAG